MTQWCDWVKSRVLSLSLSRLERLWVPAVSYKGSTTVSCKYWLLHSHLSSQGTWHCIFCIQPFAHTHTHVHTLMAGGATADTNQSIKVNQGQSGPIWSRESTCWSTCADQFPERQRPDLLAVKQSAKQCKTRVTKSDTSKKAYCFLGWYEMTATEQFFLECCQKVKRAVRERKNEKT